MECSGWPDLGPVSTWTEKKGGQVSKWKWKSYFFSEGETDARKVKTSNFHYNS